jgi:hypothetical protein
MGLLDDAIREHLELKRRHGAAETEVERLEAEVFGPGRLPAAAAPSGGDPAEVDSEPAAPLQADPATPPAESAPPGPTVPEPEDDPAMPPTREVEPEPAVAPETEPPPLAPPTPAPPGAEVAPAPRPEPEPWLDERDEVPAEEALEHPSAAEEPSEDVLEETPDFLQETPDHERLWFEQKPPRDFDFDR